MLRRLAKNGLQCARASIRRNLISYYTHEEKLKPENSDLPKWAQFFTNKAPNIEFDIDRTLLNDQQGEADDYALRYILTNYKDFKSYQLLRSLLFVGSFVHRSRIVDQIRKNILNGDYLIYAADIEVLARIHLIFFLDDPLLVEFAVYNIAKQFKNLDFIGKVYGVSYMMFVSKVSEPCLAEFLHELPPLLSGKESKFQSEYDSWPLQLKFFFIFSLQNIEIFAKSEEHKAVARGLLQRHLNQVGSLQKVL